MSFLASSLAPTATVLPFAAASAPSGWLLCNGAAVSRTTYAELFAAIGTTYGVGDGSTTFNVPNAQGVFLRGAGSQTISSISYTGTRGTTQGDQMQGHRHPIYTTDGSASPNQAPNNYVRNTQHNGTSLGPITDGTNGNPRIGSETRPANISVNYIIKI